MAHEEKKKERKLVGIGYFVIGLLFLMGILVRFFREGPSQMSPSYTPTPTSFATLTATVSPTPSVTSFCGTHYAVKPGDTLARIAVHCGVTVSALLAVNPALQNNQMVYAGQVLELPYAFYPRPTQDINLVLTDVAKQNAEYARINIAHTFPESMKLDETVKIDLLINPSLSQEELLTQVVERSQYPTSTAEPGELVTDQNSVLGASSSEIEITQVMKAVLTSEEPDAFIIHQTNGNAEQPIDEFDTTKWTWSVTAKESGNKHLVLVVSRLVKVEGEDYWTEVVSYREEIPVRITAIQVVSSWDWKWIVGISITLITVILIPLVRWRNAKKETPRKNSPPPKKYRSG